MKALVRFLTAAGAVALACTAVSGVAHAEGAQSMALYGIMQQMQTDMDAVQAAITQEDWKKVAELAPKIAHHEQPPLLEKVKILTWLNVDAPHFKGLDGQVEKAATAMGAAAQKGDKDAVVADYAQVQQSCVACHDAYRDKFIAHFGQ